jgi:hypothetical protein
MNNTMKYRMAKQEIAKVLNELLESHSASDILDCLIEECPKAEMDSLVDTMETELRYRGNRKMIKIDTLDQEIKLEEFLDQLYPMDNDRQLAIL